ncbi:MAG: thioredoxin [Bacteroidetes bacterium]|nr:MAG: thioredoxin [Bacteroidota bacterium]
MKSVLRNTGIIVFVIVLQIILNSCSSSKYSIESDENGKPMIVGHLTWEEWQENAGWESYSAPSYMPNLKRASEISDMATNYGVDFLIFAGSWCSDSETELPKLYKLITGAGIFPDKILLYGVDRQKNEPSGTANYYKIEKVPTLVLEVEGEEIGRIVETPKLSWEEDILNILREYKFRENQEEPK